MSTEKTERRPTTEEGGERTRRARTADAAGRRTRVATGRRESGSPGDGDLERLALAAKALADPARLRILALLVEGRSCCGLPDPAGRGVPGRDDPQGICVCELQSEIGLGQSTTSYHLRVLRDAGLVREEPRGKWTFYELDRDAAAVVLTQLRDLLRV